MSHLRVTAMNTASKVAGELKFDWSKSGMGENKSTYLVWEDLTVVTQNLRNGATKKLLSGLSGYAEPDRIMAIMGPSGSGKSILLDALAGRLSANVIMSGSVLLNGKQRNIGCRDVSYVTQEDTFLGTLTVRETLTYSAHMRLPTKMSNDEINDVVEKTIIKMGLSDCADNKIGNWHFRGISSGEKRRVSISIEILTEPQVMFLDEPTSGLDSASAFIVIQALSYIAHDGRIVVCSIHQPSSHLFDLFDDLFLLSSGEAIYFGDAKMAVKFFAEAGFPCPSRRNPSDHFLRCINSEFDKIAVTLVQSQRDYVTPRSSNSLTNLTTKEIKATLLRKYESSEYIMNTRKRIQELTLLEELVTVSNKSSASKWKQLCTLTRRSSLNMSRDLGYFWLRILFYILVALCAGINFYNIGLSYSTIIVRAKCDAFVYGFMICLSVGGLPSFIEEFKVTYRERLSGHYGEAVFVLSNFLSSFPYVMVMSLASGTIIYHMVKFHPGFSHYSYFCINLFCCMSITESCAMIAALVTPNVLMAVVVAIAITIFMMMASVIFTPDLPKFFWRYPMSYISFSSWAIQGQYKNDMIGLEFHSPLLGDHKVKGETILRTIFGLQLDHSKWWDLAALMFLLLSYRVLLFLVLKYKGRTASLLRTLYAKRSF